MLFEYMEVIMTTTKIEWSEKVWNPVTGCTKVSTGCKHCYAEKMAYRLQGMGQAKYVNGFEVTLHPDIMDKPLMWRKPSRVFVNSMSDLFHEEVPKKFVRKVFKVMGEAGQHQFQVLTKRSERMAELSPDLPWADNIWVGVTVEKGKYLHRIDHLLETPASIKFVSLEPLLGALPGFSPACLDWVIVGGESGPGARHMEAEWVTEIRDKCVDAGVAFFFKQWGGRNKKTAGCLLDGRMWNEYPA
jgi:protein gp37